MKGSLRRPGCLPRAGKPRDKPHSFTLKKQWFVFVGTVLKKWLGKILYPNQNLVKQVV